MKKNTVSSRAKKLATFAGMLVICVGAVFLVMSRVNASQPEESPSSEPSEIILGTPHTISVPPVSSAAETGSAFVPSSGTTVSEPLTTVSKPTSAPPKPTPPASSALTDKSKKPTYSSKPTASKSSTNKKSTAGYNDPVFGNKVGTGGQAVSVPDYGGDINKQVGIMD